MPRSELTINNVKTSSSNTWKARILPARFYDSRNTKFKTDNWNSIDTKWEDYE